MSMSDVYHSSQTLDTSQTNVLFLQRIGERLEHWRRFLDPDPFTFAINGTVFRSDILEAVQLSPSVVAQLLVDATSRTFVIVDDTVNSDDFDAIRHLLREITPTSVISLCRALGNHARNELLASRFHSYKLEDIALLHGFDPRHVS
jgi:hypothetical protein